MYLWYACHFSLEGEDKVTNIFIIILGIFAMGIPPLMWWLFKHLVQHFNGEDKYDLEGMYTAMYIVCVYVRMCVYLCIYVCMHIQHVYNIKCTYTAPAESSKKYVIVHAVYACIYVHMVLLTCHFAHSRKLEHYYL